MRALVEVLYWALSRHLIGLADSIRYQVTPVLGYAAAVWTGGQAHGGRRDGLPGEAAYTVPALFPTEVFSSYYVKPGPTTEPQPVMFDPVLNVTFPLNLTSPLTVPETNLDAVHYPKPVGNLSDEAQREVMATAKQHVLSIFNRTDLLSNCTKCIAALGEAQVAAQKAPSLLPAAMVELCQETEFKSTSSCQQTYEPGIYGAVWTQILASADIDGLDGQLICSSLSPTFCPQPGVTEYTQPKFPKARPANVSQPRPSGERVKVLHLSDLHLDPRYEVGSEANCTSGLCCRHSPTKSVSPGVELPAGLYGYYRCDSPYYLALAAIQSIGPLTGTNLTHHPAFTLYTGDLVSHDRQNQLSQAYVENVELSVWTIFSKYIGGPVYSALGNHDSSPANQDAPHALDGNGPLGQQFSWNYKHVSSLWQHYGWIDASTAEQARTHYAAYSLVHAGLRIISINTDFYYQANLYAFLNATDPDHSGMFTFLITELQAAEDAGQRAWIVGHVLPGWAGRDPLPNGADMLYQIVERYSPHVIAALFFGHSHEDQAFVYYAQNGTDPKAEHALAVGWVGPSLTPLHNLNSGFRLYEVDTGSWDVWEAFTFHADVDTFSHLDGQGPVFQFEYSTREAYAPAASWPPDAPLNASFWHRLSEALDRNRTLVELFNTYQGKSSVHTPNCTSDACAAAKVCYIRSASAALGRRCPQGFESVQSEFSGQKY